MSKLSFQSQPMPAQKVVCVGLASRQSKSGGDAVVEGGGVVGSGVADVVGSVVGVVVSTSRQLDCGRGGRLRKCVGVACGRSGIGLLLKMMQDALLASAGCRQICDSGSKTVKMPSGST